MWRNGDVIDDLYVECARDSRSVGAKQRQQAIEVTAAVADAMAVRVERDAWHEYPVDGVEWNRRTARTGFRDAAIADLEITFFVVDAIDLEHPRAFD